MRRFNWSGGGKIQFAHRRRAKRGEIVVSIRLCGIFSKQFFVLLFLAVLEKMLNLNLRHILKIRLT
jgi:hypothetical protein